MPGPWKLLNCLAECFGSNRLVLRLGVLGFAGFDDEAKGLVVEVDGYRLAGGDVEH